MNKLETLQALNAILLDEMPSWKEQAPRFPQSEEGQWLLFRSLVNVREPGKASEELLRLQDGLLQEEVRRKGIVTLDDIPPVKDRMHLWLGDITRLGTDAIVNAANSGLLGCNSPLHYCIDNAIHTYAGVQLRYVCAEIMARQGHPEPTGQAKITPAFNLPSRYVLHTVGPIISGAVTPEQEEQLASCYTSCLSLAEESGARSVAFCCISTGVFSYPKEEAAKVAVHAVGQYLAEHADMRVVFNVFSESNLAIYRRLLQG